ncbi:hypothetical protein PBY51_007745 [Eleginops maclovinus]|uniref:Uncharacterized protein n=1 Tax=Eleginops maclovinus TaxID=56733 RepID=A0AAN7X709_ELEMC|nr:hypothetical protein PBY51_007745 [Eleginops maclovinus]
MVLSTAPIFSMGTLMFAPCGAPAQTALQPALPCPALDLGSSQTPLCSRRSRNASSQSVSASARAAEPPELVKNSYQTHSQRLVRGKQLTSNSITLESFPSE